LREEHGHRVFENRVLTGKTGPKREEVTTECRKLHEELNDLHSPNINLMIKFRRMRWVGHVACMGGDRRGVYRDLVGKPEGKRPLGTPRHR
jgi:hypothetical protein